VVFPSPPLFGLKNSRDWLWGSRDLIAQALQRPGQLLLDFAMIRVPYKKGFPFLVILLARFHHLVLHHQNAMADRQCCSFTSSPLFEPAILLS